MISVRRFFLEFEKKFWEASGNTPDFLNRICQVTALVVRVWIAEKPLMRAAALTYTATLTLIPTLAMVFGVLNYLNPAEKYQDAILSKLSAFMTESAASQVQETIIQSVDNINSGSLAGFSLILVLAGAMTLISSVEEAFNHIWGIRKLRKFKQRFITYLAILVTGPMVLLVPLTLFSAKNLGFLDAIPVLGPFIQSTISAVLPLVLVWMFLFILYYAVPNIEVSIFAAVMGSLVAAIFFSGNQLVAVFLVSKFQAFDTIYGSLATIPIFLLGVFISWLVVLCGAQITYAWQNVEGFRREYLLEEISPGDEELVALSVMCEMARKFSNSGEPLNCEDMGRSWQLPDRLLRQLLGRLEQSGLVYPVGGSKNQYLPGRPLEDIPFSEVIHAIRFGHRGFRGLRHGENSESVNQLYCENVLMSQGAGKKTLKEIVCGS